MGMVEDRINQSVSHIDRSIDRSIDRLID